VPRSLLRSIIPPQTPDYPHISGDHAEAHFSISARAFDPPRSVAATTPRFRARKTYSLQAHPTNHQLPTPIPWPLLFSFDTSSSPACHFSRSIDNYKHHALPAQASNRSSVRRNTPFSPLSTPNSAGHIRGLISKDKVYVQPRQISIKAHIPSTCHSR
jgi:hypothetical protein